jgi:filamentous hemagglutinin family protein
MAKRRRSPRHQPAHSQAPALQELATSTAVAVVLVLGGGGVALALPEGMVVTGGQLELSKPNAHEALIHQGTTRAAADFHSFNIGADQRVQIVQPSAASALLGRITGGNITEIHGRLDANGRVLLVNPAGVLVGPTGVINTAAFAATTLQVDPAAFMENGRLELKAVPGADPQAAVINQGTISVADGGFAALIAPHVVNNGVINARLGQVQLAAGTAATLDISGDGLVGVVLDPAVAGSITHTGTIRASHVRLGGNEARELVAATVQLGGVIEARSGAELLGLDPVGQASITVASAGQVTLSGRLDASSTSAQGGAITVQGEHISLASSARLDATGSAGGGQILIGGSWQNGDPNVRQATTTTIDQGAVVDASAAGIGNGGTIVAWSDITNASSRTTVAGTLLAKGGVQGGDGGRIETSGYDLRVDGINLSTLAPLGKTGEWLLDPYNITISSGTASNVSGYTATGSPAVINVSTLQSALNSSNVTVFTGSSGSSESGNITVDAVIDSSSNYTLTLQAANNITINQNITRSGTGGLTLLAGGGSVGGTGKLILGSASGTTLNLSHGTTLSNNIDLIGNVTVSLKFAVEYLIVGGGGGGGAAVFAGGGGGGGGGQVLQGSTDASGGTYSITVGGGGLGAGYTGTRLHGGWSGGGIQCFGDNSSRWSRGAK